MIRINKAVHFAVNLFTACSMLLIAMQPSVGALATEANTTVLNQDDGYTRQTDPETGRVNFISLDEGLQAQGAESAPVLDTDQRQERLRVYLAKYGPEFGLANPSAELDAQSAAKEVDQREVTKFQQKYNGIPVMGGEIIVDMSLSGMLLSMNGEVSPDLSIDTTPAIDSKQAADAAKEVIGKNYGLDVKKLNATQPELWIFDESLLNPSTHPAELVWRMDVTAEDIPFRELVLVNAQTGGVSMHFNQVDSIDGNLDEGPTQPPIEVPTEIPPTEPPAVTETAQPPIFNPTPTPAFEPQPAQNPSNELQAQDELSAQSVFQLFVNIASGSDSNDCVTAFTPCQNIQAAVSKISSTGNTYTINVSAGTYVFSSNPTPNVVIINTNNTVVLSGGWNGTFTTQAGASIIDGQNTNNGLLVNGVPGITVKRFVIQNSISNNSGAIYLLNSHLTLDTVALKNNHANGNGAGVYIETSGSPSLTLLNTTISNNTAFSGAGLFISNGTTNVNNSTIVYNNAVGAVGGGIIQTGGSLDISNSIVANNTSGGSAPDCSGIIAASDHNIIENIGGCTITTSTNDQIVDPLISSSLLGSPDFHAILVGSPAIDAGNSLTCEAADIRGMARPQGSVCDIGAYEYTLAGDSLFFANLTGSNQNAFPGSAFADPLTVTVIDNNSAPVAGVTVTFTAPSTGPSATFADTGTNTTAAVTNSSGIASSALLNANSQAGSFMVVASASGISGTVSFDLSNKAWYVSPTGNNSNSCASPNFPCLTINGAIGKAASGDVIYVSGGTYTGASGTEVVLINKSITLSGGWDSSFMVRSQTSIIDGQGVRRGITTTANPALVDHFTIQNGYHGSQGGGIYSQGNLTLSNSNVVGNHSHWMGGGVYNSGTLTINNSNITGNLAGDPCCSGGGGGGGIQNGGGTLTLNNSTVSDNTIIGLQGSGINVNGTATLNNTTVAGNTGGSGDGIYTFVGIVILNNSTIANNQAFGVRNVGGNVTLQNTIIASNGGSSDCSNSSGYSGTVTSLGYNLVGNTAGCSISAVGGDKFNVASKLNMFLTAQGYYPLLPDSPAIDSGNPATCLAVDQRGVSRPQASACDIGAYEYLAPEAAASMYVLSGSDQKTLLSADFPEVFSAYVLDANGSPVPGINITLSPPISGASGTFSGSNVVTTAASGVFVAPVFTANGIAGSYTVDASAPGVLNLGHFQLENSLSVATTLTIDAGSPQYSQITTVFPDPLKVLVKDQFNNPLQGVTVTYSAPASGASGLFSDSGSNTTTAQTGVNGIATSALYAANSTVGTYAIVATVAGISSPVNFQMTNAGNRFVGSAGSDSGNDCSSVINPCLTIKYAISQAVSGDTINVSSGTYTGIGSEVVLVNKNVTLSGGWDSSFSNQNALSTIDAQSARRGVTVNSGTSATFDRFVFQNGTASSGGGIYQNSGSTLTLSNSVVRNNTASQVGGGIYNLGNLTLGNSLVANNTVTVYGGGGIYNGGSLILNNSTVSGNQVSSYGGHGGGISTETTMTMNNSTITNNMAGTANGSGGGIYVASAAIVIRNSILAGNTAVMGPDCRGAIVSSGHNLLGKDLDCTFTSASGDLVGTSAGPINPRLTTLQDNGGPTYTHALMVNSLAIDSGDSLTCLATDQRGIARPVGLSCDIGAYEGSVPWVSYPHVKTYTAGESSSIPGTFLCDQSDPNCSSGDADAQSAHKFAIGTYDFYSTRFDRDSIDDNGMVIKSTVHYCDSSYSCPYGNAYWDGTQMVYGSAYGFTSADDIVAHELTHGVTQYESNLFYWYQSGAINESLSDVWGEAYDQSNGLGNDTPEVKWLLGEDTTGLGAIRNMSNPTAFGDPDKISSAYYVKSYANDGGGVHTNSGVNNKAVSLMVDGGIFNGQTISPLGWDKVLTIYYEVQTNLLTSGSDYLDLYNALYQACNNKIGVNGISAADCQQVRAAAVAVEMYKAPSGFAPAVTQYCATGSNIISSVYSEDFETGTDGWSYTDAYPWQLVNQYATSGTGSMWADTGFDGNTFGVLQSPSVNIPYGKVYLQFKHAFDFETGTFAGKPMNYDGGVVEYSLNGGATWVDLSPMFNSGQNYNGVISTYTGDGNPLRGRKGFIGDSHGYVDTRYDVSSLGGQNVLFRWKVGVDIYGYYNGWYLDDVAVTSCLPVVAPTLLSPGNKTIYKNNTGLTFDWGDVPDATSYTIQVGKSSTLKGVLAINTTVTASSYTPASLPLRMKLFWRVAANTPNGRGPWSKPKFFTTANQPGAPILLSPPDASQVAGGALLFDWSTVVMPRAAVLKSYEVQVSSDAASTNLVIDQLVTRRGDKSYFTPVVNLPSGTSYYWRVRTFNTKNDYSDWSNTASFDLLPVAPTLDTPLTSEILTTTPSLLNWEDAANATGYTVEISATSDFSSTLDSGTIGTSEYTPGVSLPADGSVVYWRVRTESAVGSGVWAVRSFTIVP